MVLNVITCLQIDLFPQYPNIPLKQDLLHQLLLPPLFGWLMMMTGATTSKMTMMRKTCTVHEMEVMMRTVTREDCPVSEETVLVCQCQVRMDWLDWAAPSVNHELECGRSCRVTSSMFLPRSWLMIISTKTPSTLLVEQAQLDTHHLTLRRRLCHTHPPHHTPSLASTRVVTPSASPSIRSPASGSSLVTLSFYSAPCHISSHNHHHCSSYFPWWLDHHCHINQWDQHDRLWLFNHSSRSITRTVPST